MTLVIPTGFASIIHSLNWSGDPEPMAMTYGVLTNGLGPITPNDVADECAAAFIDNLLPEMSSAISLVQTEAYVQEGAPGDPLSVGVSTDGGTGADAGTLIPQNSAYLAHKRSGTAGRGGRGRFYVPGILETDVDNLGNVGGAKQTAWNVALAAFLAQLQAGPDVVQMVVLHDSAGAFAAADPAIVTSLTIDPVIATQRRRLRR